MNDLYDFRDGVTEAEHRCGYLGGCPGCHVDAPGAIPRRRTGSRAAHSPQGNRRWRIVLFCPNEVAEMPLPPVCLRHPPAQSPKTQRRSGVSAPSPYVLLSFFILIISVDVRSMM